MAALESRMKWVRYCCIGFNTGAILISIALFCLCIWMRASPDTQEWISRLEVNSVYAGVYILMIGSALAIFFIVLGCFAVFSENTFLLKMFVGFQIFMFILGLAGAAVLLDFSTKNSKLQPMVRESMIYLISESRWERNSETLRLIQENIGCCGADGAQDYVQWRKPLPPECRDSVTGNAYFHGCVDEMTWYVEDKSQWLAVISMILCLLTVINCVCTLILIKGINIVNKPVAYK